MSNCTVADEWIIYYTAIDACVVFLHKQRCTEKKVCDADNGMNEKKRSPRQFCSTQSRVAFQLCCELINSFEVDFHYQFAREGDSSRFKWACFCLNFSSKRFLCGRSASVLYIVRNNLFFPTEHVYSTSVTNVLIHFLLGRLFFFASTFRLFSPRLFVHHSRTVRNSISQAAQTYLIQLRYITLHGQHRKNYAVIKLKYILSFLRTFA